MAAIEKSPVIDAISLGPITVSQAAFERAFESDNDYLTFVKADAGANLSPCSPRTRTRRP